jgi:hypothetical protein
VCTYYPTTGNTMNLKIVANTIRKANKAKRLTFLGALVAFNFFLMIM